MLRDFLPIILGMGATLLFLYIKAPDHAVRASYRYINLSALRTDCDRECTAEVLPRVCHYNFVIERRWFRSPREQCSNTSYELRPMLAINHQVPGPAIHVCEGDFVVVNVKNALLGMAITLHWHGMRQKGSTYMDGVPLITQCPILSGTSFQYVFQANAGTHFYRAHSVPHQADGVYGPMIVRQSSMKDPTHRNYDLDLKEHVITISPLTHSVLTTHINLEKVPIHSLLINGNRLLKVENLYVRRDDIQPKFYVSTGRRYRLRVISASPLDCPVLFSIDRHNFTVIQADGSPVKPVNMSGIILHPGERYDLVIRTDQLHGAYELNVQGYQDCAGLHQQGLLVYFNTSHGHNESALKKTATSLRKTHKGELDHYIPELKSLSPVPGLKELAADYRVYLPFDVILMDIETDFNYTYRYYTNSPHYRSYLSIRDTQNRIPRMDNFTFKYPSTPLVYEQEQASPLVTCSHPEWGTFCAEYHCQCVHTLDFFLGSVVDIILVNLGKADDRPVIFHLHGNGVYVLGAAEMGDHRGVGEVKDLDHLGKLKRNLHDPPFRDMILVPPTGYVSLRLIANNPGYWMLEAPTIDPIAGYAMALVIRVGEVSDMPPLPEKFPRCGSFKRPEFVV